MRKIRMMIMNIAAVMSALLLIGEISHSGAGLPNALKGMGCWVQKSSLDNPLIYDNVFDWYITDIGNMELFVSKTRKPVFLAYGGKDVDYMIRKVEQYKARIAGVVWDYEPEHEPMPKAESDLARIYAKTRALNIPFAIVTKPDPDKSLKVHGVSYARAERHADILMPMMYVQWYAMKKEAMTRLLAKQRSLTRLPIVAVIALRTTKTRPPRRLYSVEIGAIYKGMPVDGFCIWNVKELSKEDLASLASLKKGLTD